MLPISSNKTKLICIPFAGGNRYSFLKLKPHLTESIDFVTVELPGRGNRMMEPLLYNLDEMVDDLARKIAPHLQGDYMIYGHSMGAALGNLLIHRFHKMGEKLPLHFIATGRSAPRYQQYDRLLHLLSDQDFKLALKQLGGLPEQVLANDEIMEFFLPVIRADIQALETSRYQIAGTHPVPMTAIAGTGEAISDQQLQGWKEETNGDFEGLRLEGNHFFILDHLPWIAQKLAAIISSQKMALS